MGVCVRESVCVRCFHQCSRGWVQVRVFAHEKQCVCMGVCVRERERERARDRVSERERVKESVNV